MHFFLLLYTSKLFSIKLVPVLHSCCDCIRVLILSARFECYFRKRKQKYLLSSEVNNFCMFMLFVIRDYLFLFLIYFSIDCLLKYRFVRSLFMYFQIFPCINDIVYYIDVLKFYMLKSYKLFSSMIVSVLGLCFVSNLLSPN